MTQFYIVYSADFIGDMNILTHEIETEHKLHAYVETVTEADNIAARLEIIGGLMSANIYGTKEKAQEVAAMMNEHYKAAGCYHE